MSVTDHDAATAPEQRRQRILLVDDEPHARAAARRVLRTLGHEVLEAAGGKQACLIAQATGPLDLLLTDLNMPEMDGFELARRLQQKQPGLTTLYMCGYPVETIENMPPGAQLIEKPFTFEDLIDRVSQLLDAP